MQSNYSAILIVGIFFFCGLTALESTASDNLMNLWDARAKDALETRLMLAAIHGNLPKIKEDEKAYSIDLSGVMTLDTGRGILDFAVCGGNEDVIRYLLSRSCDPSRRDINGNQALHHAGMQSRVINILLDDPRVDPYSMNSEGMSVFAQAILNERKDIVLLMLQRRELEKDIRPCCSISGMLLFPLDVAVLGGQLEIYDDLLSQGFACTTPIERSRIVFAAILSDKGEFLRRFYEQGYSLDTTFREIPETPLTLAAKSGKTVAIQTLAELGLDMNQANPNGALPLHLAIAHRQAEAVHVLLMNGAGCSFRTIDGKTTLNFALQNNDLGIALDICRYSKEDINIPNDQGMTPLEFAARNHNKILFEECIRNGADLSLVFSDGFTPLTFIINEGLADYYRILIENHADLTQTDGNGNNPLEFAIRMTGQVLPSQTGIVAKVLSDCSVLNIASKSGNTPLLTALQKGYEDVAIVLLNRSADGLGACSNGEIPLIEAIRQGFVNIAENLLEHGAAVNQVDCNGNTPLLTALEYDHEALAQKLLMQGAALDVHNKDLTNCLIAASKHADMVAIVRKLCKEKQEQLNQQDRFGNTALHYAAEAGHTELVKILIQAKAPLEVTNNKGYSPLLAACKTGDIPTLKLFLAAKANILAEGNEGETVKTLLEKNKRYDAVSFITSFYNRAAVIRRTSK